MGIPRVGATLSTRVRVALLAWFAMLGLDFLLNGALFASMYQSGGTFMLAPAEAFRRIPLGYLAILVAAFGIVEIAHRLRVTRITEGIRLGLVLGGVVGSVWSLSLFSISTLGAPAGLAFAVLWLLLLLLGSMIAAAGLARASLGGLVVRVAALDAACIVTVITLQSSGTVPTVAP